MPIPVFRLSAEGASVMARFAGPLYGCMGVLGTLLVVALIFASTPDQETT